MEKVLDRGSKVLGDRKAGRAFRDLPDQEIEALVQSLSSLREGELGIDIPVACGRASIKKSGDDRPLPFKLNG
jgi:hypothetical protein